MASFEKRLEDCMRRGDMTISDLARWFDRPRATINTWVTGRTPYGPSSRLAEERLWLLEYCIRNKRGFPVPANLSWTNRANYIRGQRDDAERHVSVPRVRVAG